MCRWFASDGASCREILRRETCAVLRRNLSMRRDNPESGPRQCLLSESFGPARSRRRASPRSSVQRSPTVQRRAHTQPPGAERCHALGSSRAASTEELVAHRKAARDDDGLHPRNQSSLHFRKPRDSRMSRAPNVVESDHAIPGSSAQWRTRSVSIDHGHTLITCRPCGLEFGWISAPMLPPGD